MTLAIKCHAFHRENDTGAFEMWHPIRVALKFPDDEEMQAVSLLHDAATSHPRSAHIINSSELPNDVKQAIDRLVKRKEESLEEYFIRLSWNEMALKVKIAEYFDLLDLNMYCKRDYKISQIKMEEYQMLKKIALERLGKDRLIAIETLLSRRIGYVQ